VLHVVYTYFPLKITNIIVKIAGNSYSLVCFFFSKMSRCWKALWNHGKI